MTSGKGKTLGRLRLTWRPIKGAYSLQKGAESLIGLVLSQVHYAQVNMPHCTKIEHPKI